MSKQSDAYLGQPDRVPVVEPIVMYRGLRAELFQAFEAEMDVLTIVANVTSLIDQAMSKFTGVDPLAAFRSFVGGDIAGGIALIQAGRYQGATPVAAGDVTVTDPASGKPCPFSQAANSIVAAIGPAVQAKIESAVSAFLAKK